MAHVAYPFWLQTGDTRGGGGVTLLPIWDSGLLLPEGLLLLLPVRLALLMSGLEVQRAVPGPQILWLAQDLLLWLAWHALS